MSHRIVALTTLAAAILMLAPTVAAQQATPRTAWGDPDLQGVYTFATETPLQRPVTLADKDRYSEAELKKVEEQLKEKHDENIATNEHFSYNALWFVSDQGRPTGRTSLIVDPENGRMPPLTPLGEKLRAENAKRQQARLTGDVLTPSWEDHTNYNRCIARSFPRISHEYNQGVEVLQTPKDVTIFYESMHDARIIPLDGRPHLDATVRQWNGDSRGHWEGDTLVIDTVNFTDRQQSDTIGGFPQGNLHLTERLRRVDAKTVNYVVTVEDPTYWTRPWTLVLPWRADDPAYKGPEDLFEYACHEGNYRMMEDTISASQGKNK